MAQVYGAYDVQQPNSSGRLANQRALLVFRLYKKFPSPALLAPQASSFLAPVLNPINTAVTAARNFLQQDLLGPLQGRILVHEFQFVLILERFDEVREVRAHFSYTRDGFFLDTPLKNALGVKHFRLAARTHWTPVSVNGVLVDGDAAVQEFAQLIDDYFYPGDGTVTSDYELYLIDFRSPISAQDPIGEREWIIFPMRQGPRLQQTAARPLSRMLSFDFLGLQSNRDKAKAEDGFLSSLLGTSALAKLLDTLGLGGITDALKDVFGTLKDVQGVLDDVANVVTAATDYVTGATQLIQYSIGQVRGLALSVRTIIGRLEDGADLVKQIPDLAASDLALLQRDFPGLAKSQSADPAILTIDQLRRAEALLNALSAQPQSFALPIPGGPKPPRTVAVQVRPGDTIEAIAREANIDVATLIATNNLRWPFVDSRPNPAAQLAATEAERDAAQAALGAAAAAVDAAMQGGAAQADIDSLQHQAVAAQARRDTAEAAITSLLAADPVQSGVLYAGDTIRVPQPTPDVVPSVVDISPELAARIAAVTGAPTLTEEDRLFGLDLLLDDDGNLEWTPGRNDLALERGLDHMARVQVRYVRLPLGDLFYAVNVGNFAWRDLGRWQGPATNQLLAYAMWLTLRQDPRVKTIRNVTATTFDGLATLSHDVELISGMSMPDLRVPVP